MITMSMSSYTAEKTLAFCWSFLYARITYTMNYVTELKQVIMDILLYKRTDTCISQRFLNFFVFVICLSQMITLVCRMK